MRRHVKSFAVCLVVGVVVNVLVAWGCAMRCEAKDRLWVRTLKDVPEGVAWPAEVAPGWPHRCNQETGWGGFGVRTRVSMGREVGTDGFVVRTCSVQENGWPWLAFRAVDWTVMEGSISGAQSRVARIEPAGMAGSWRAGLEAPFEYTWASQAGPRVVTIGSSQLSQRVPLPIRPVWPGFAMNTLMYSVVAWGVLFAPGVVRRWRRGA